MPWTTRLAAAVAVLAAVQGGPASAEDSGVPPAVEARARVLAARIDALPPGRRKARAEATAVRELQRLVLREAEADAATCRREAGSDAPACAGAAEFANLVRARIAADYYLRRYRRTAPKAGPG